MLPFLAEGDPNQTQVEYAFGHTMPHELFPFVENFAVMIGIAAVLIVIIVGMVDKRSPVPRGIFRNALEGIVLFIRGMTRNAHLPADVKTNGTP